MARRAAKALPQPLLVLQGSRDFHVTVADDLPLWRAALEGKAGTEVKLYPRLNHAFVAGEGEVATVEEYSAVGHVDPRVVADIPAWINR